MGTFKDITGQQFGDFIIDSFDPTKGKYKYYWNCHCVKCGYRKLVEGSSIRAGNSTRCVCNKSFGRREDLGYERDISGKVYGGLTVLSYCDTKSSHSRWLCKCNCGNEEVFSISQLKRRKNLMCSQCVEKYKDIRNVISEENLDSNGIPINIVQSTQRKQNKYEIQNDETIINDKIIVDSKFMDYLKSFDRYIGIDSRGYAYFSYCGQNVYLHRLLTKTSLFFDMSGKDKDMEIIDHINRNRCDNRIKNLRMIKKSENPINCSVYSNNKSGHKGISLLERLQKWQVNIQHKKINYYVGVFENIDDAILARKRAEIDLFGKVN